MISCHLAKSIFHDGLYDFKICTMHNLLVKEWIKYRSQKFLIVNLLNSVPLHGSDPQYLNPTCVNLRNQLISLLVVVVDYRPDLFYGCSLL